MTITPYFMRRFAAHRGKLMALLTLSTLFTLSAHAQTIQAIPSPKSHFGFELGADYHLANFTQTEAYFKKLDAVSDRLQLVDIGETEEGRRQYMLVMSSPENLRNLPRYREISQRLARAEMQEDTARLLASEGKPVVWIDGGLHSSETVAMHQLIDLAYQLASRDDEETKFILDRTIILLVHANPDGQEIVANWYMRNKTPEKRSLSHRPLMYHKYIGHDNNRDFFMLNMKESQNIARQLFVEWIPQIMYNHHQTAPPGAVVAGAPYRDPHNFVFDPLLMTSIDALGAAMHSRLNREGKPGYTQRNGSVFSTWYNGGLRTTTYFHNIVGLLTEVIGGPNPMEIPLVPNRLLPTGDTPNPVLPQSWHFQQSLDYSLSMNYAVLNYAARHGDEVLYNIYRMGRNSIEKGSRDTWSITPSKLEAIRESAKPSSSGSRSGAVSSNRLATHHLDAVLGNPSLRDARGYVIPSNQPDFPTAVKFLNALIRNGIQVHVAKQAFELASKTYPAGSYLVKTNQAFRPHILDMFEPQDHPNDFQYEGGPPIPPYDAAGWTPAYLMNVQFDRILNAIEGPFEPLPIGELLPVPSVEWTAGAYYSLPAAANDSYLMANELIKKSMAVYRDMQTGDFLLEGTSENTRLLRESQLHTGVAVKTLEARPPKIAPVKRARVGLWDSYGGSMPSGWIRWIGEQYGFQVSQIFAADIDRGNLYDDYDVLIFVGGAIPERSPNPARHAADADRDGGRSIPPIPDEIPLEHRFRWGRLTSETSIPALAEFLHQGGRIVTIGSSANLAFHLGLPVKNALTEWVDGREQPLSTEKYFTPGSVLRAKVASDQQANWGLDAYVDVYFNRSPVFQVTAEGLADRSIVPLLWFDTDRPLRSGWSWGQSYLKNTIAAFQAPVGEGSLLVFGPEITFRAQAHGTFKLLFNQLFLQGSAF